MDGAHIGGGTTAIVECASQVGRVFSDKRLETLVCLGAKPGRADEWAQWMS
jgi:hypothetical protein